jgi:hypothetical protein
MYNLLILIRNDLTLKWNLVKLVAFKNLEGNKKRKRDHLLFVKLKQCYQYLVTSLTVSVQITLSLFQVCHVIRTL